MSDLIQRLTAAAALYEDAVLGRHTELRLAHENSESKLVELKEHLRSRRPPRTSASACWPWPGRWRGARHRASPTSI